MAVTISLAPIQKEDFSYAQARHLLNRAGFGGSHEQIEALVKMGPRDAVDYLVDYERIDPGQGGATVASADPNLRRRLTREERMKARQARARDDQAAMQQMRFARALNEAEDRQQMDEVVRWWLGQIISTPRPLEEKLTLLWHGHFASNYRTVRDSFLMYQQNEFLRKNAAGSFEALAHGIVRDPAMIRFLDNNNNRKEEPNENLAREMMELFTLGEGHYTEKDIKEGARALTGYTYRDNDFEFVRGMHDGGEKTILGKRGRFDGDDFVDVILAQAHCARFICQKLYNYFVADLEDKPAAHARSIINQLATHLRRKEYELKPILRAMFLSRHFYDPAVMAARIKSPVELIAGTLRTLRPPVRDLAYLADASAAMGQRLFDPPSVAGWAGGRSWINTATLFVRQNTMTYLLTGKLPFRDGWTPDAIGYDPLLLVAGLESVDASVDHVLRLAIGEQLPAQRREQLLAYVNQRGGSNAENMLNLLMLVTTTPEYQLC